MWKSHIELMSHPHLYFSSSGQDIVPWPFFCILFPGLRPEIKTGLDAPNPNLFTKKNKKNRAGTMGGNYEQCICEQNYRRI